MSIDQSNSYRKEFIWLHFDDESRVQVDQWVKDQKSYRSVSVMSNSTDMTAVFRARSCGSLIKVKSSHRRKKLQNQGSHFLEFSLSNRDSVRDPIQWRRERQSQHHFFPSKNFCSNSRLFHFCMNNTKITNCSNEPRLVFPALKSIIHFSP